MTKTTVDEQTETSVIKRWFIFKPLDYFTELTLGRTFPRRLADMTRRTSMLNDPNLANKWRVYSRWILWILRSDRCPAQLITLMITPGKVEKIKIKLCSVQEWAMGMSTTTVLCFILFPLDRILVFCSMHFTWKIIFTHQRICTSLV